MKPMKVIFKYEAMVRASNNWEHGVDLPSVPREGEFVWAAGKRYVVIDVQWHPFDYEPQVLVYLAQ
jgi:hypothetical protein